MRSESKNITQITSEIIMAKTSISDIELVSQLVSYLIVSTELHLLHIIK